MRWLSPAVEKFPSSHKFTLDEHIYQGALNVLDDLVEAIDSWHATPVLLQVNLELEKLQFLLRLAVDLQLLDLRLHRDGSERTPAAHRVYRPVSEQGGGPIFDRKRPLLRQVPLLLQILYSLGLAFSKQAIPTVFFKKKPTAVKPMNTGFRANFVLTIFSSPLQNHSFP